MQLLCIVDFLFLSLSIKDFFNLKRHNYLTSHYILQAIVQYRDVKHNQNTFFLKNLSLKNFISSRTLT